MHIGGLRGLHNEFVTEADPESGAEKLRIFSALLPYNILLWNHIHPNPDKTDADQEKFDRFVAMSVILKRVNVFYNILVGREFNRSREEHDPDDTPKKARHKYSKHDHQNESCVAWYDRLEETPGDKHSSYQNHTPKPVRLILLAMPWFYRLPSLGSFLPTPLDASTIDDSI
jgi:hypothetical protein